MHIQCGLGMGRQGEWSLTMNMSLWSYLSQLFTFYSLETTYSCTKWKCYSLIWVLWITTDEPDKLIEEENGLILSYSNAKNSMQNLCYSKIGLRVCKACKQRHVKWNRGLLFMLAVGPFKIIHLTSREEGFKKKKKCFKSSNTNILWSMDNKNEWYICVGHLSDMQHLSNTYRTLCNCERF